MKKNITYTFKLIETCNMCGASTKNQKILGRRLSQSQGFSPSKKLGIATTVCQCASCGLIFANPLPMPANIQDHYGVPPENYWKPEYFRIDGNYFRTEIETFKKLKKFTSGMRSLDIGAGLGKQMLALERAGFDSYGFEPSEPFYRRALAEMKVDPRKLRPGMIEQVEYDNESFDFISFGAVLEHLYDPSASIRKALAWLKQDGLIHIEVPSSNWMIGRLKNLAYKVLMSDYVGNLSPMHEPYHLYEFGLKSFLKNGQIHNYQIVHHQYYVCQTFLPAPVQSLANKIMDRTNTGMQLAVWLKKA